MQGDQSKGKKYDSLVYDVDLAFIKKINNLKWWQFSKNRKACRWRKKELKNIIKNG